MKKVPRRESLQNIKDYFTETEKTHHIHTSSDRLFSAVYTFIAISLMLYKKFCTAIITVLILETFRCILFDVSNGGKCHAHKTYMSHGRKK